MGKMKNLAIDHLTLLQSGIDLDLPLSTPRVYALMDGTRIMKVFADKALADFECHVCIAGNDYEEQTGDYWVQVLDVDLTPLDSLMTHDTVTY